MITAETAKQITRGSEFGTPQIVKDHVYETIESYAKAGHDWVTFINYDVDHEFIDELRTNGFEVDCEEVEIPKTPSESIIVPSLFVSWIEKTVDINDIDL